jgi:hypothetical protein
MSTDNKFCLDEFFHSENPAALSLPHLITLLDAELIGKVCQLTKSRPGLWPLPAPFDENDLYNEVRENAPFSAWSLGLNQAEVQSVGRMVKEALFSANLMLIDSSVDETSLAPIAQTQGRRLANGAWFTPGYQDLPTLPKVLEIAKWALIPLGPGRARALFITAPDKTDWVEQLHGWCHRQGRDISKVVRENNDVRLSCLLAPGRYRDNAIGHRIDAFLGDMDLWFGIPSSELASRMEERIQTLGKLRESIAKARESVP